MISYKIRVAFSMLIEEMEKLINKNKNLFDENNDKIVPNYLYDQLYNYFKEDISFTNIPIYLKKEELTNRLILIIDKSVFLNINEIKTIGNMRIVFKFPKTVKKLIHIKNFLENIEKILDKHNI